MGKRKNNAVQAATVIPSGFNSREEAADMLAKSYAYLHDDPESLELAAQQASRELIPKQLQKAVPFENDDLQHSEFKFQDFNDKLLLDQLYTSDVRPSGISNETIRALTFRSILISTIIQRRIWQLQSFSTPQRNRYDLGYCIEKRDSEEAPTSREQADIDRLSNMIFNLGFGDYDPMRGTFIGS